MQSIISHPTPCIPATVGAIYGGNMKKLAFLLALLMVITPLLAACGKDPNEESSAESSNDSSSEKFLYNLDSLPELDYGKKSFGIFIDKDGADYLIAEEENGDLVNDAVFQRNLAIEERYNLKFNMVEAEVNQPCEEIKNFIMSGDTTYHMFINVQHNAMPEMILNGYFVDWNEMEYLDYTKPYWNSRIAKDINFGGKVYTMAGDLNLTTYNSTNCILFNKNLFDDLGIDYPYQDVYDLTWTAEKFDAIVKQGYKDLNGNQLWDPAEDRCGFSGWSPEMSTAMYIGFGGKPVINDENNMPTLNINSEHTEKIFSAIANIFDRRNAFVNTSEFDLDKKMVREGRILMDDTFITGLSNNRDSEFEFGLVPYPMLDEDQGEYYSRAANIAHLCYIPTTNTELHDTGIILEAMSIESYNSIRPTYYDVTLSLKEAKDEETLDMVNIILDSSSYIVEGFVSSGTITTIMQSGQYHFASWYASNEGMFKSQVKKMVAFYSGETQS